MYQEKIEFYKNRTIGERFSVAGDFIRQNWKVLLKNIAYIGAPLALLQGYFSQSSTQGLFTGLLSYNPAAPYANINWLHYSLLFPFSSLLLLFLLSMTGSILNKYIKGSLTEETGWVDLKSQLFSFAGRIFLQGLILSLAVFAIAIIISVFAGLLSLGSFWTGIVIVILFGILVLGFLLFIFIPLMLIPYPIFFEDASAWQGIKKGFRLGFKYWGSTFLTVLLGWLLSAAVSYILAMPYFIYILFNAGGNSLLGYALAMLSSLIGIIVLPVLIIFLSFQYTSIIEKEEGVSLQDKIEGFDNL
jgi:hypothetical protein